MSEKMLENSWFTIAYATGMLRRNPATTPLALSFTTDPAPRASSTGDSEEIGSIFAIDLAV
jgi:hypothetical protein